MKRHVFTVERDGFYGAFYEAPKASDKALIIMLGDSSTDRMAKSGAKWAHSQGCHALAMSPDVKDYGHHNYPLERFGHAIEFLQGKGCKKIGIAGASTTGMLALVAASYYPQITLTVAISPSDFVMEGFYRDGKDGATERPGDGESTVTWQGEPLPYLPYAYRHPEYDQRLKTEAKAGGDLAAARQMFDESERLHPVQEAEKIKVERIRGKLILIGAEDDVLWDTCKYIRRMCARLEGLPHKCVVEALTYEHGTHFAFPQSMLKAMLPIGGGIMVRLFKAGRQHPKECLATRLDIDERLQRAIREW